MAQRNETYKTLNEISRHENKPCQNGCPSICWDDHDIHHLDDKHGSSNLKRLPLVPVQCTEDLAREHEPLQVHFSHSVTEDDLQEKLNHTCHALSLPAVDVQEHLNSFLRGTEQAPFSISEADFPTFLSNVSQKEESCSKKLVYMDETGLEVNDEDDNCLVLHQYVRKPFWDQLHYQISEVYMLHSPARMSHLVEQTTYPEDFHRELKRLSTFTTYPADCPVFAIKLAQDGFVFRPELEAVECVFCRFRGPLSDLYFPTFYSRYVDMLHRSQSRYCPLLQDVECRNEPVPEMEQYLDMLCITENSITVSESYAASQNMPALSRNTQQTISLSVFPPNIKRPSESGLTDPELTAGMVNAENSSNVTSNVRKASNLAPNPAMTSHTSETVSKNRPPDSNTSRNTSVHNASSAAGISMQGLDLQNAKRPDMADTHRRLASYRGKWEKPSPSPEELANAGMYYAGYADCARCFFCARGLKDWKPDDEPWIIHSIHSPSCGYLLHTRGMRFINIVRHKHAEGQPTIRLQEVEEELQMEIEREEDARRRREACHETTDIRETASTVNNTNREHAISIKDLEALQQQNEELMLICKICMERDIDITILPCGHVVSCHQCAAAIRNCPLCRRPIKKRVKGYFS